MGKLRISRGRIKPQEARWSPKRKKTMGMVLNRASKIISDGIDANDCQDLKAEYRSDLQDIADLAKFLKAKYKINSGVDYWAYQLKKGGNA